MSPASPAPRPRRRRLWLLPLLFPLGPAAIALVVLRTDLVEAAARNAAELWVARLTGEQLDLDRIELSYVPLRVTVRGIRLTHPADGARIATATSVAATFGFAGWRPALLELDAEAPQIELHLDPDGLREFRGLPKRDPTVPRSPLPARFPWERLVIHDLEFALHTNDSDGVELHDLDVDPDGAAWTISVGGVHPHFGRFERTLAPFTLADVDLAPDHVRVPEIDLSTEGLALQGDFAAGFGAGTPMSGDLSAHVDLSTLTRGEDPRKYVAGVIDVDATLDGSLDAPRANGQLLLQGLTVWGVNGAGEVFSRAFGDAHGPWSYADDDVHVGRLEMAWDEAAIGVEADVDLAAKTLAAGVTGENLSLGRILQRVGVHHDPWVDFNGDVEVHVAGPIKPLALDGPFEVDLTRLDVTSGGFDTHAPSILAVHDARLAGNLHIDGDHFVIDADTADFGPTTRGRARADVGLKHDGPLVVDADFDRLDLGDLAPLGNAQLGGVARAHGRLEGPFDGLHANLDLDGENLEVLGFLWADRFTAHLTSPDLKRLQFTDLDAELGRTHYKGNIELAFPHDGMRFGTQLYVTDGSLRDLVGIFKELPGYDAGVTGTLVLDGPIYHMKGEAQFDLADLDLWGEHFPRGHLTGWMDDGLFTLEELRVQRDGEGLLARGTVGRGWAMNMDVVSDGFRVERLDHIEPTGVPVVGDVVVDARVGGTLFDWKPEGRLALRHTRFAGHSVADSTVRFHTDDPSTLVYRGDLVGGSCRVDGSLGIRGEQPYGLHAEFDAFPFDLLYPVAADGNPVTARLSGDLDLDGRFGDTPTPVSIRGNFDRVHIAWNGHDLTNPERWRFLMTGTEVTIPTLRLKDGNGPTDVTIDGQTSTNGQVALRGGGTLELDLARAVAPGITEARGTANVQLGISGSRETGVAFTIDGKIHRGYVQTDYFPEPIEDLDATFHASPTGYDITAVDARLGGGAVDASGRIDAAGWVPTRYDLRADVLGARVKYFDSLPAMRGDAHLRFDGPVGALQLGGKIDLTDVTWSDRIPWEEWVVSIRGEDRLTEAASAQRKNYFGFDLDIHGADTVHIRNNVGDLDAGVSLRVAGDTAQPELTGSIDLDPGGVVYFNGRQLDVQRGQIRYVDPTSYDPDLDLQLTTDVHGQEQDYHVNVAVTGPMSDKKITPSGEGLSEADLNSLLLTGMTVTEFERYGGIGAAVAQSADLFGKQLQDNVVVFDRWNLTSGVNERGTSTLSSDLRIVVEKDLPGDFKATGETTIPFNDDYYLGLDKRLAGRLYATLFWASKQEGRALDIGGAYGAAFKYRLELD